MKTFVMTWNTHGESALPEIETDADLAVISLQECYGQPHEKFNQAGSVFKYVKTCSMFGLKTIIKSREKRKIKFYRAGQGPLGFVNKGFIMAEIDDRIVHINAHLAAYEHNQPTRLRQLNEILDFIGKGMDTVILSGDLNFRCCPFDQGDEFKQLNPQFKEEEIHFKPTYKYCQNGYDPARRPSYCDRVMVASIFNVEFKEYRSLDQIKTSDHKPVVCWFTITKKMVRSSISYGGKRLFIRRMVTAVYLLPIEEQRKCLLFLIFIFLIIV